MGEVADWAVGRKARVCATIVVVVGVLRRPCLEAAVASLHLTIIHIRPAAGARAHALVARGTRGHHAVEDARRAVTVLHAGAIRGEAISIRIAIIGVAKGLLSGGAVVGARVVRAVEPGSVA